MPTYSDDPVLTQLRRAAMARREYLRAIGHLVPDDRTPAQRREDVAHARREREAATWIIESDSPADKDLPLAGQAAGESTLDIEWRRGNIGHRNPDGRLIHPLGETAPDDCAECFLIAHDPAHTSRRLT